MALALGRANDPYVFALVAVAVGGGTAVVIAVAVLATRRLSLDIVLALLPVLIAAALLLTFRWS